MTKPRLLDDCLGADGEVSLSNLAWALDLDPGTLAPLEAEPTALRAAYTLACRARPWLASNAETGRWLTSTPIASLSGLTPLTALAAGHGEALLSGMDTIPEMQGFAPATMALADTRDGPQLG